MKLFIVHASSYFRQGLEKKEKIEEIADSFPKNDVVELRYYNPGKVISHKGFVIDSGGGEINDGFIRVLLKQREKEYILTGGIFGECHKTAFRDLHIKARGEVFLFPAQAIYGKEVDLETIRKAYNPNADIYLDGRLAFEGADKCEIRVFSTNENLFEFLRER